ncbi:unnamed protein product [Candidula unifasciata]|uniref:Uncharacterized protein n=1 Tax=Candidula unifasciata TaxID=100452 RepID=A0A8S3Z7R6_9EUPU|nr:unnamed protein product [Candidula unifasciata]
MQRLRSEWSNGIFRQSSDEKMGVKRQTYDGGGSGGRQLSSDSDDSCRRLAQTSYVIRSDSDSDSDPKKWTKNPLVVKRVKRSDKLKQAEKRFSGTESVLASRNRDSFVSQGNGENRNRVANVSVKTTGSKDEGSGSKASSKYQKLEQMRKMRLNLSVTSDEENVPQRAPPHRWSGSNIRSPGVWPDHKPLSQTQKFSQTSRQTFHPLSYTAGHGQPPRTPRHDDSLDELVESNIQYLSSDVEKVQPKRSSANNVIKFSSLPEHGKIASRVLSSTPPQTHPSIQVQANTSIHLHVTLPTETPRLGTSLIQIAPSADWDRHSIYGFRNQLTSQPDLIPKNFPQDIYSPLSQTRNDYNSRQSVIRTSDQLGGRAAPTSQPTFGTVHTRLGFGDKKPRSDTEIGLLPAKVDKGMFSDAEYDIEVSERVKKWETLLKVRESALKSDKRDLVTISENVNSNTFMPPASDTHKAVVPSKQSRFVSSYADEPNPATVPRVMSIETNARRFFQVIPDARMNIQVQDVSNRLFPTPLSLRPEKTFTSASELRQQVLASRVHPLPVTAGPVPVTYKPSFAGESGQQVSPYKDTSFSGQQASPYSDSSYSGQPVSSQKDTPVVRRISNKDDVRNPEKRGSKYREELNEISCMKSDSVGNLRRRFDTDSTNATSEDDKKSVSTASAKLSKPSKEYSSQNESTDWSQVLPSYNTKLRDSEVWSPNLESTQGVPVSIERVTARTLRTIPFSEDPFWKEIEQMTTFDPSNREAMLTSEPVRSHHQVQLIPQQSFTLPAQPHRNVTSVVDKLQKSKSLYTPNIAPLTIDVNSRSSLNAANALDDVLNDINRSPRKQLSPKKRSLEIDSSTTNVATSDISRFLKTRPNSGQFGKSEYGKSEYGNDGSTRTLESGLRGLHRSDVSTARQQQPLQLSQLPRQPNTQHRQAQPSQGFTNNYQLDVNLLKQKLLNTGLAEAETEEIVDQSHYQSPSLGRPTHKSTSIRSIAGHPYSSVASKPTGDARLDEPSTWSQHLNKSNISTTSKNIFLEQPQKQPGSKTLDEIQKALAPFSSTTYRPDPETLYGVSKLQAFKHATCDTSVGPHTSATGWSYHTDLNTDMEQSNTVDSSLSAGSSRLQEVNESMDDLTNLARGVELRISEIKNKLQSADETSLDQILLSLKKLTPEIKSQQTDTATFEDYYEKKKSKLSDALSELDRIYTSLELNTDSVNTLHKQDKPQSDLSSLNVRRAQPKSVHLRPMQTRISSVFIRDLDANRMSDNLEKESEFDVISKSFQAIVDEVNQTTDLLSRAVERSRQDNIVPETHKLVSKPMMKPGNVGKEHVITANCAAQADTATCAQNSTNQMLNTDKLTAAKMTNTVSSPPSSAQQLRFRPVKDNKIIQGDKATKKDSEEKVFKVMTSPKPSPTLIRKLFNEDQVSQTKPHFSSHDHLMKQHAEVKLAPLQITVKVESKHLECQDVGQPGEPVKPSLSSYESKSSIGSNRAETLTPETIAGIRSSTLLPLASKSKTDQSSAAVQTADVSKTTDGRTTSSGLGLSSAPSATTVSSVFVPSVGSSKLSKHVVAGTTSDQSDSTSKNDNKTKRHVGSGVAMMLGRFSSSQESIDGSKKSASTRVGDKDGLGEEKSDKEHLPVKTQPIDLTDGKVTSDANLKSPVRSSTKGKPIHNFDMKPTNAPSLERKLVDPEAKLLNSGASSPQPSSPVSKPPQSPWKRHTSDPEKQSVADAIKAYSPKCVSKIPRPASSNGSTASDGYFTPKELESPRQVVGSPGVATSKERPPVWKSPAVSPRARARPHSFHELISVFEKDPSDKLQTFDKFRKSASAGEVSSNDCLVGKGFRFQKMVPEETTTEK